MMPWSEWHKHSVIVIHLSMVKVTLVQWTAMVPPMRYTEAKMTKITLELLRDINKDTIDFLDNYDGTEREPEVLPSRFPNLIVNGASGIAVGMATNIPPHNLTEVINGVLHLSKNPDVTIAELMEDIQGPDFPTGFNSREKWHPTCL